MKNRVLLIVITIVAVTAMAFSMAGCGCSKSGKSTVNPNDVPTDNATGSKNGMNYVNDEFGTISPTQKTTDKKGNTVIKYTDSQGNQVTRTMKKNGMIILIAYRLMMMTCHSKRRD